MNRRNRLTRGFRLALLAGTTSAFGAPMASAQVAARVVAYTGQAVDPARELRSVDHAVINDDGHVLYVGMTAINSPGNDECESALEIFPGIMSLGNTYATTTVNPNFCGDRDAWFRFTSPTTGQAGITLRCSGAAPDLRWQVYSGTCELLTPVGSGCAVGQSFLGTLSAGQVYFLRVGSNTMPGSAAGIMTFSISFDGSTGLGAAANFDVFLFIDRGSAQPVLHQGDATSFDSSLYYRGFSFPALGPGDRVAIPVTARSPDITEPTGVSLVSGLIGGVLTQELRDVAPPSPMFAVWKVPVPQILPDGSTAYSHNAGDLLRIGTRSIDRSQRAPGTPETVLFDFLDQPVVAGRCVAFRSTLAGSGINDENNMGLWVDLNDGGASPMLVARLGSPAPGAGAGVVFASMPLTPALSESGLTAFLATVSGTGVTPQNDAGIWRGGPGNLVLIARTGSPVPDQPGALFRAFSGALSLNRRGDLLIRAHLAGDGIDPTNDGGLWLSNQFGALQRIAGDGDQAPGLPEGVLFDSIMDPVLGSAGDVAYTARLRGAGVDRTNKSALFLRTRDGRTRLVARGGDPVAFPDGSTHTLRSMSFGQTSSGGRLALNHRAQVLYTAELDDFAQALLVTNPACAGDWDHSGVLNSDDFFAFLQDFFASAADFNRDGLADTQDFFDFLSAFFDGCQA
ncbi:MAG: choice-of-anchor tandem repeat NxxGxxAF-containing protein [Phycisphaerales bacterium]